MERRYEYLYGQELQNFIAREPIAWVPLGILERHGEHLPYGLDGLKAHGICLWLADRLGGVVLPATHLAGVHSPWFGDDLERYRKEQRIVGDFYVRPETLRMLAEDTVDGLANLGFKKIVLYSGHYPGLQRDLLREVAQRPGVIAFAEPDAWPGEGDHAGKAETSLYMVLGGEVHLERITPDQVGRIGWFSNNRPLPTAASIAHGQEWLDAILKYFQKVLA